MNRNNVIGNFMWRFLERCGAQGVTFVVSIVLARLLDPGVYGTVALVTVFTAILQVFVDSGFGNALIQKKNADDLDFSTVFYFNIFTCLCLYGMMFIAAPWIADFYDRPELVSMIRVLSLIVVISGVKNIQQAYVARNMLFRRFFFSTLGGTVGAAIVGIVMAYRGYEVWALVAQMLFNATVDTVILWFTVKWRPKLMFSFDRLKILFSFGWKLLASSLIDTVYNNLRQLIIGKLYTDDDLAHFNRGKQFPNFFVSNVITAIDSVLLPVMSVEQDDRTRVADMTRRAIKTSSFIVMPLMTGLAVCTEPLVTVLLTEKWLPCVPYMQLFCIAYVLNPIHTANLNALKAIGRSDVYLKLEVIKKILGLVTLAVAMPFGVMPIAYSVMAMTVISGVINALPNRKLLGYGYLVQLRDIAPPVVLSAVMGVIVYSVSLIGLHPALTLVIQIPLGIIVYFGGARLLHMESFGYILSMLKGLSKNK